MKPKDILGLVLRLLAVLFLYRAVEAVPMVWRVFSMGISMGLRHLNWSLFLDSLFMVAWQLAVAYWLIRGAPPVMNWAYPAENREVK